MDHRIYKEIPQVRGPRELGKLQTSFNLTTFYECYLARVISFAPATKEPILLQARLFTCYRVFNLNIFAIIQSTFYRVIKGQKYLKKMYEIDYDD